jgi:hypothetical protein
LDLPIGHIKGYRLASKNPGTRAVFGRARPKTGLRVAVGSNLKYGVAVRPPHTPCPKSTCSNLSEFVLHKKNKKSEVFGICETVRLF